MQRVLEKNYTFCNEKVRMLQIFFEIKKADTDHLKGSPGLLRPLFFYYLQHHSRTQLKDVPEDQAVCNCLMLLHTVCVLLKQFFLLVRYGSFELFFIPANQFQ